MCDQTFGQQFTIKQRSCILPLLVDISKVLVLTIRQILKGVHQSLILAASGIFLRIDALQMPAQKDNDKDKKSITSHVR
jgi:hypothetical protein